MEPIIITPMPSKPQVSNGNNNSNIASDDNGFAPVLADAMNSSAKVAQKSDKNDTPQEVVEDSPIETALDATLQNNATASTSPLIAAFTTLNTSTKSPETIQGKVETGKHISASQLEPESLLNNTKEQLTTSTSLSTKNDFQKNQLGLEHQDPIANKNGGKSGDMKITDSKTALLDNTLQTKLDISISPELVKAAAGNTIANTTSSTSLYSKADQKISLSPLTPVTPTKSASILSNLSTNQAAFDESQIGSVKLGEKDSITVSTNSLRDSRYQMNNLAALLNNTNNNSVENPRTSLTTENIIANLAEIPMEPEGIRANLRESLSLRHDISGQYLSSRIQKAEINTGLGTTNQQFGSQDESSNTNILFSQNSKSTELPKDTSYSNVTGGLAADKTGNNGAEAIKPMILSSSTPVFENNIINQVVQKFRVNQQQQDSKLVMKLHPAELGELKVDIQLKGGSINASIVAQSQQALEILEKNMQKLKTLMEQQGLTVGNITVTLDSDVGSDFNLFHQQFANKENSKETHKSSQTEESFDLSLENVEIDNVTSENSVNVKA